MITHQCIGGFNLMKCVCVKLDQKYDNWESWSGAMPILNVFAGQKIRMTRS